MSKQELTRLKIIQRLQRREIGEHKISGAKENGSHIVNDDIAINALK